MSPWDLVLDRLDTLDDKWDRKHDEHKREDDLHFEQVDKALTKLQLQVTLKYSLMASLPGFLTAVAALVFLYLR